MESFAALFEESLIHQEMRSGEVITAEVISVDSDHVIVNAGLKSESVIAASEFHNLANECSRRFPSDVRTSRHVNKSP